MKHNYVCKYFNACQINLLLTVSDIIWHLVESFVKFEKAKRSILEVFLIENFWCLTIASVI